MAKSPDTTNLIQRKCAVEGCGKSKPIIGGYCEMHYQRVRKHGDPTTVKGRRAWGPMCLVEGCAAGAVTAGFCTRHYLRKRRNGDPKRVRRTTAAGDPMRWLREHISHQSDECLAWPFSKRENGYGQISARGRPAIASRVMCILAHGEPPFDGAEAAHSCGNGHKACVNPKHLRWATHTQNMQDAVAHGTTNRGEKCQTAKLVSEQVVAIFLDPRPQREIAKDYPCAQQWIGKIKQGKSWGWLTEGLVVPDGHKQPSGERNGNSVLTADSALAIYQSKSPKNEIAAKHGVSVKTIDDIKRGRTWRSVTGASA